MKDRKQLLQGLKKIYKQFNENFEDSVSEKEIKLIDIKNFTIDLNLAQLPDNIKNVFQFPAILNKSYIDSIKYDETNKEILVQFKLNFKEFSRLFIDKMNQLKLFKEDKTIGYLKSFGQYNIRLYLLFVAPNDFEIDSIDNLTESIDAILNGIEVKEYSSGERYTMVELNTVEYIFDLFKSQILEYYNQATDEQKKIIADKYDVTKKELNSIIK